MRILSNILSTIILFSFVFFPNPLNAANIDYLAKNATLIVTGSVNERVESSSDVAFTIHVKRVLSGSVDGNLVPVVHRWAGLLHSPTVLKQAVEGIFFLTSNEFGEWNAIPARPIDFRTFRGLFLPATSDGPKADLAYTSRTSVIEKIASEIIHALEQPGSDEDPSVLVDAFTDIAFSEPSLYHDHILKLEGETGRTAATAWALSRSSPSGISLLARNWVSIGKSPYSSMVLNTLTFSWRTVDPDFVRTLMDLGNAAKNDSPLRYAVAETVSAIHTMATLPYLAKLLHDSDKKLQFFGASGFSAYVNGCPVRDKTNTVSMSYLKCQNFSPFKSPETMHNLIFRPPPDDQLRISVDYWKSWWAGHPELSKGTEYN